MKRVFIFVSLFQSFTFAQSVTSQAYDLSTTGTNSLETRLTPANVASGKFGFRCSIPVDGQTWAQPLYVQGLTISGATHDVAFVATMHDSIYAADVHSCAVLWHTTVGTSWTGYPENASQQFGHIPELGCLSTPVIDLPNGHLFASCATNDPTWTLFKIDLATGSLLSSVAVSGQVVGTGDTNPSGHTGCNYLGHPDATSGPNLLFAANSELQRPALKLNAGVVYVEFGGIGDSCPYHGWLMSYSASSLVQTGIWCSTPNGWGGALWAAGGPSFDPSGNVYVTTGNGTAYDGITDFTDSVVKFSVSVGFLDWFTPLNNGTLDTDDADVSANRFVLIPGTTFGVIAAKDFNVYLLDQTCLGHLQGSSSCAIQTFKTNASGVIGNNSGSYGAAFMGNTLFLPLTAGDIYAFPWAGSAFSSTPIWHQANTYAFPGPAQMSASANGAANGILWVVTIPSGSVYGSKAAGTLRAIDPSTGAELWNSGSSLGNMAKFAPPLVADSWVIVPTQDTAVQVFGLLPSATLRGAGTLRGAATVR